MRPEPQRRLAVLVEAVERAVLDGVCEFESEPDRVRVELGIVVVFDDERPLIGLAGLLDWRSSGRLSSILRSSFFTGAAGEQLLTPGDRRWPCDRLVVIGAGARAEFDEAKARQFGARCIEIATGLDVGSVAIALPSGEIERGLIELAFDALLDAIERRGMTSEPAASETETAASESEGESESESEAEAASPEAEAEAEPEPGLELDPTAGPREDDRVALDLAPTPESEPGEATPAIDANAPNSQVASGLAPLEAPLEASSEASTEPEPERAIEADPGREPPAVRELDCWVLADESVVARLRRVRAGPPRPARGAASLYT